MIAQMALAGGDSALAKVKSFQRLDSGKALVEIEWVKEKGFIANNTETKLRFDLYNWPKESRSIFYRVISLVYNSDEKDYPKAKFEESLAYLEQKFKTGETFNLGQMGTVQFRKDKDNPDQIIVPFADLDKQLNGEIGCFLYAAPI